MTVHSTSFLFLAALCCFFALDANAAGLNLKSKNKSNKPVPVELTADGGLEWDRNKLTLTALKKAVVSRDDLSLAADKIIAYYKENGKDIDVYKVRAQGRVLITSPNQTIRADAAEFLLPDALIVLTGNPVTLRAGDEKMTAQVLKYWKDDNIAEAERQVVATKGDRRLEADSVKAFFSQKNDKFDIDRFEAYDNVTITNNEEKVTGDFGMYNVRKETATLRGNVKISQGENYIVGEVVDVNMKTGVSRLQTPEGDGKSKGKVHGVFLPETKKKSKKAKEAAPNDAVKEEQKTDNGSATQRKEIETHDESTAKLLGTVGQAD